MRKYKKVKISSGLRWRRHVKQSRGNAHDASDINLQQYVSWLHSDIIISMTTIIIMMIIMMTMTMMTMIIINVIILQQSDATDRLSYIYYVHVRLYIYIYLYAYTLMHVHIYIFFTYIYIYVCAMVQSVLTWYYNTIAICIRLRKFCTLIMKPYTHGMALTSKHMIGISRSFP